MYELPKLDPPKLKGLFKPSSRFRSSSRLVLIIVFSSIVFGFLGGALGSSLFYFQIKDYLNKASNNNNQFVKQESLTSYTPQTSQEKAIIDVVEKSSPAVVSIIISKDMPVYEQYYENPFKEYEKFFGPMPEFKIPRYKKKGVEKKEIGGGTGFIVSKDGLVLTNKHVVLDEDAEYTVLTNDGRRFSARVLAKDPVQDLAVIKIEREKSVNGEGKMVLRPFPTLSLGGINTAVALEAQNIGFAIPINKAKRDIEQVRKTGKIVYPFLGIRYILINDSVKKKYNLSVSSGALIVSGDKNEPAVMPGSAADKAGLKKGDVVLEFNGEKITQKNSLSKIISKYNPGDKVKLKILRDGKEIEVEVILGKRSG